MSLPLMVNGVEDIMSSLGQQWREVLPSSLTDEELDRVNYEVKRREVAANLPKLVKKAIAKRQRRVQVYGWVTGNDVPGMNPDRVDSLAARFHGRPLSQGDVSGIVLDIVNWCRANDLNCYIVSQKVPLNDFEYNIEVGP